MTLVYGIKPKPIPKTIKLDLEDIFHRTDKFIDASFWFSNHRQELLNQYNGEFIGVLDEKVIAHSKDIRKLDKELIEKTGYGIMGLAYVTFMSDSRGDIFGEVFMRRPPELDTVKMIWSGVSIKWLLREIERETKRLETGARGGLDVKRKA